MQNSIKIRKGVIAFWSQEKESMPITIEAYSEKVKKKTWGKAHWENQEHLP